MSIYTEQQLKKFANTQYTLTDIENAQGDLMVCDYIDESEIDPENPLMIESNLSRNITIKLTVKDHALYKESGERYEPDATTQQVVDTLPDGAQVEITIKTVKILDLPQPNQ
jgi:hypothetical protein